MAIDHESELTEQYAADGYFKMERFAGPSVGHAMLDDVVDIVQRSDRGEQVDALVLPEAQPDFAARDDAKPEDVIAKVFKLHRRPAFASFLRTPELLPIVTGLLGTDAAAGTVDNTEKLRGHKSPVNDWSPLIREGVFV